MPVGGSEKAVVTEPIDLGQQGSGVPENEEKDGRDQHDGTQATSLDQKLDGFLNLVGGSGENRSPTAAGGSAHAD
jgi:hypothetical protein